MEAQEIVSERPNVVLAVLLAIAALFAGLLGSGLLAVGGHGVFDLATAIADTFSACVLFVIGLQHVPLTSIAAVVLATASLAASAKTMRTFVVQHRLLRSLPLEPLRNEAVTASARAAGIDVYVTPASRPTAFCFGLIRPRVVITDGLLSRLDSDEQAAVVCHEVHHARSREPLKCLTAKLVTSAFFWLPILADLLDRYLLVKELAADCLAAQRTSKRALAGALHEVSGTLTPAAAVGLAEHAAARVDRLFDSRAALPPLWRRSHVALSALATFGLAAVAVAPTQLVLHAPHRLQSALDTMSHSLARMCLGLVVNTVVLVALAVVARQLLTRRRQTSGGD